MQTDDDPVLGDTSHEDHTIDVEPLEDRIRRLLGSQLYGVLCTHGDDQAYGSLVAFAFSKDLTIAVFSTPIATRKYRLLSENERIALVVDDRPDHPDEMMEVQAVTATGRAAPVGPGELFDRCSELLVSRHPQLEGFVAADSCALFQISIARFFHVSRFQEVCQWVPRRK